MYSTLLIIPNACSVRVSVLLHETDGDGSILSPPPSTDAQHHVSLPRISPGFLKRHNHHQQMCNIRLFINSKMITMRFKTWFVKHFNQIICHTPCPQESIQLPNVKCLSLVTVARGGQTNGHQRNEILWPYELISPPRLWQGGESHDNNLRAHCSSPIAPALQIYTPHISFPDSGCPSPLSGESVTRMWFSGPFRDCHSRLVAHNGADKIAWTRSQIVEKIIN